MKQIYRIIAALLTAVLLFTAGCSKPAEQPGAPTAGTTAATGPTFTAGSTDTPDPTVTTGPTVTTAPTEPVPDDGHLSALRQIMTGTPHLFAVAYFGYHDTIDSDAPVDPIQVMQQKAPQLCADLPFLLQIPEDRIIGQSGELYCIVPIDEDATVAVDLGVWDDSREDYIYDNSLYRRENGDPILLFCNDGGWEPDIQLQISGPSGEVVWYPRTDDHLCADPLRSDDGEDLFLDLSPYRQMLTADLTDMKDSEWIAPTEQMLIGSTWIWSGFLKDGREVSYQVSFQEDVLSVRWNDGIDAEDHVYPDAAWELVEEQGFTVLSIDLREFAGIHRYIVYHHEVYEQLYVAMDVTQDEMPIGREPLYRSLTYPPVPEPSDMIGTWGLAWTEVEGDRNEAEPGTEHIRIFLNDQDAMRISLTDQQFPDQSFYDKQLETYAEEMYPGCGNDQWLAYVGYMGPWDTIYSLTLRQDGTLLMRMYWEVDGAPMVAHKGYRKLPD